MSETTMNFSRTIAAWVQVAIFLGGLVTLLLAIGRRDAMIDQHTENLTELKSITSDLVRSQLITAGNYQLVTQRIGELERRINLIR